MRACFITVLLIIDFESVQVVKTIRGHQLHFVQEFKDSVRDLGKPWKIGSYRQSMM